MWLKGVSNSLKRSLNHFKPKLKKSRASGHGASKYYGKNSLNVPENLLESVILKNGMRLISECKESEITTVGFFLPAGSMHELPEERGASLLMEHLLFKRTECRTQDEILDILEETGARVAALAMRDMFLFYGTVPSCDLERIVELLADVVLNGLTCEEDLCAERCMIFRELAEMETDHERVVMDYLASIAYYGNELGRSVYPKTRELENLRIETVRNFRSRLFDPSLMTMVCTGGTSFSDIQNMTCEYFLPAKSNECDEEDESTMRDYPCTPFFRFTGSDMRLRDDDEEFGYAAVAVEGPGYADCQDHCTLTVAKEFIGSWNMSFGGGKENAPYLAQNAPHGDMCHTYKSFNVGWSNTGLWGCYFACEKMQLQDMMWILQREWMKLCSGLTNKEVARAVHQCRMSELLRVNDSVDRFFDIATCIYRRGSYETFNQRLSRFESVTAESLKEVANRYIYDQCLAVAAYGRIENLPDYNMMRSYMHQIRR